MRIVERIGARGAIAVLVAAAVALAPLTVRSARADTGRDQAREHYAQGKALFEEGKYQQAIAEFAAADKLAPSPILEFNVALCYDRLGDKKEALRRYRIYLDRMPDAPNRLAVQSKIRRLESALEREEARRAEEAKETESGSGVAGAHGAEGAGAGESGGEGSGVGEAAAAGAATAGAATAGEGSESAAGESAEASGGSGAGESAESAGQAAAQKPVYQPTGDPELDRVAGIDVAAIREQRDLPAPAAEQGGAPEQGAAAANTEQPAPGPPPAGKPVDKKKKKKSDPLYKQWWFWVVVGVSAIILIDIASSGSNNSGMPARARMLFPKTDHDPAPGGGAVLLRF